MQSPPVTQLAPRAPPSVYRNLTVAEREVFRASVCTSDNVCDHLLTHHAEFSIDDFLRYTDQGIQFITN